MRGGAANSSICIIYMPFQQYLYRHRRRRRRHHHHHYRHHYIQQFIFTTCSFE
jgi:hypothetical protein